MDLKKYFSYYSPKMMISPYYFSPPVLIDPLCTVVDQNKIGQSVTFSVARSCQADFVKFVGKNREKS
jgi:hypothetical protein